MKRSNVGERRRRDLISDLPTSILHLILSFLPSRDVATTSVLSKQWNYTQKSYPVLVFAQPSKDKERLGKYLDYVDKSLHYFVQRKLRIDRMRLNLRLQASDVLPVVDTWLPLALHSGVSKIMFNISSYYNYPLPETTFAVNSSLLHDSSKFFRLQNLRLNKVILSENTVRDIIRNCPNLADLNLCWVSGLKTLDISKPNKIVNLHISKGEGIHEVFVDAPSLNHFSIELDNPCNLQAGVIDMTSCCNIRRLELVCIAITDDLLNVHISRFPILEYLHLSHCSVLRNRIRVSLQRLMYLRIVHCHNIEAIEIDAPNLSIFEFITRSYRLPELVSTNIIPGSMDLVRTELLDEFVSIGFLILREYLCNAPFKSTTLTLMCTPEYVNDPEVRFNTDNFHDFIIPPLVEVDCLDLTHLPTIYSPCWPSLLEGFMWICHPKTVTMRNTADQWIEIFCKMVTESRCLKTAKIESIGGIAINWKSTGGIEHKEFRCLLRNLSVIPRDGTIVFKLEWGHSAIQELDLV